MSNATLEKFGLHKEKAHPLSSLGLIESILIYSFGGIKGSKHAINNFFQTIKLAKLERCGNFRRKIEIIRNHHVAYG